MRSYASTTTINATRRRGRQRTRPRLLFDARVTGADGIGRVTREVLRRLASPPQEPEFELFLLGAAPQAGVPEVRQHIDGAAPYSLAELMAPREAIRRFEIDVFLCMDYKIGLPPAETRVVTTINDLMRRLQPELCYTDEAFARDRGEGAYQGLRAACDALLAGTPVRPGAGESTHAAFYRAATDWALTRSDLILAPSAVAKRQIAGTGLQLRSEPVVLPYGVDHLFGDSCCWGSEPGASPPFFLYVGQKRAHKDVGALLVGFQEFRAGGGAAELWLAGRDFESGIDQEGVRCLGEVGDGRLEWLYSRTLALVLPSREEGFGFAPFEALRVGAPVILGSAEVFTEFFRELPATDAWRITGDPGPGVAAAMTEVAARAHAEPRPGRAERMQRHFASFGWSTYMGSLNTVLRRAASITR